MIKRKLSFNEGMCCFHCNYCFLGTISHRKIINLLNSDGHLYCEWIFNWDSVIKECILVLGIHFQKIKDHNYTTIIITTFFVPQWSALVHLVSIIWACGMKCDDTESELINHHTQKDTHSNSESILERLFPGALFPILYRKCEVNKVKAMAVPFNFRECLVISY